MFVDEEEAERIVLLSPMEREEELLKCPYNNLDSPDIGIRWIKLYGINVLKYVLRNNNGNCVTPYGSQSYIVLATILHNLCHRCPGNKDIALRLFDFFKQEVTLFLNEDIKSLLENQDSYNFLKNFANAWSSHKLFTKWMHKLFTSINQTTAMNPDATTIVSCSFNCFYTIVFRGDVCNRIRQCALESIQSARNHESFQMESLKKCIEVFEMMGVAATSKRTESVEEAEKLLIDLTIYRDEFEKDFLKTTTSYYTTLTNKWLSLLMDGASMNTYFEVVAERISLEMNICNSYLHSSTLPKVMNVVVGCMVINIKTPTIVGSFDKLLCYNDTSKNILEVSKFSDEFESNLKNVYTVLEATNVHYTDDASAAEEPLILFCKAVFKTMSQAAEDIVNHRYSQLRAAALRPPAPAIGKTKKPPSTSAVIAGFDTDFIDHCLCFSARMSHLIEKSFRNAVTILRYFNDVNVYLMNSDSIRTTETREFPNKDLSLSSAYLKNENTPCDMLVMYLNSILKKQQNEKTSQDSEMSFESKVSDCVDLITYLRDKDVFIEKYREVFSKRLLQSNKNSGAGVGEEKLILTKIKIQQGSAFTTKLEAMLMDMEATEASSRKFNAETGNVLKDMFNCTVLTGGAAWKLVKQPECRLPEVMNVWKELYARWFGKFRCGTRLSWLYTVGDVTVSGKFGENVYNLVVTPLQAIVLYAFNNHPTGVVSFATLKEVTNIENIEMLKRVLHSLSCQPNFRILEKKSSSDTSGSTSKVLEEDGFEVNNGVTFKLKRVVVPMVSMDGVDAQQGSLMEDVEKHRKFVIDCIIVRIMKSRKVLLHSALMSEVMTQCALFTPKPRLIKSRIESLIEREYLERPENEKSYRYKA